MNAEGRPWSWVDASNSIHWGKFQSLRRVFCLMGKAIDYERKGQPKVSSAQLVQGMKALQEVAATGSWEAAWPHTCMPDPTRTRRHGAREEKIETVLS